MRRYLFALIALALATCKSEDSEPDVLVDQNPVLYTDTDLRIAGVEVSSGTVIEADLADQNSATYWRSAGHKKADSEEWLVVTLKETSRINYVKLLPVYSKGKAIDFPLQFEIQVWKNSAWETVRSFNEFPVSEADWLVFPWTGESTTSKMRIRASQLRERANADCSFALAEVTAGFDPGFQKFSWIENKGETGQNEIRNVGSEEFDPSKMSNWNFDSRNPIISAVAGGNSNVYAPFVVDSGDGWNVYFGGWDGSSDGHDRISLTLTDPEFLDFSARRIVIDRGEMNHVNNEAVIRKPDGKWHMLYTTLPHQSATNKPCYSVSEDGVNWVPSEGNSNYRINMMNYRNWDLADVNGSNVPFYEDGTYHFYFNDFNFSATGNAFAVHHATSTDLINFNYSHDVLNEPLVAQDVRRFETGGKPRYLMVLHVNSNELRYSVGTSPLNFTLSQNLLTNQNAADRYIVSAGWVAKGNRLYGVLYGAGAVASLDRNAINAKWLQKKVIFVSDATQEQLGMSVKAYGPDRLRLELNKSVHTGKYYIYDSDGTTLLYRSPKMTIVSGDVWKYEP